jgi:hypothetical protein
MNAEEYFEKLWDWTPLNDCFKRGIRPTDIDGCVEANGKFLILEGKTSGEEMPTGQKLALERMSAFPEFTVIIIEGKPPFDVTGWRVLGKKKYTGGNVEFKKFIRRWFDWADNVKQES